MVDVLTWQGKLAAVLAAVEKAKRRDPRNSTDYRVRQGIVYTQLGQWQEGIAALKSYLDRYPHSLWAHAYLATDYFNLGEQDVTMWWSGWTMPRAQWWRKR